MGTTTNPVPGTQISDLWPFTDEQMTEFRHVWIRDEVITGPDSSYLSAYNKANKAEWIDDDGINAMLYNLLVDRQQLLINAWNTMYYERADRGEPLDDCADTATSQQLNVIYRLLRADVREAMVDDPAYQASVPESNRKQWVHDWRLSITRDRNWGRQRSPGFACCEVLVK